MLLVGLTTATSFGGEMTKLSRSWQWAATAVTLGAALPVLGGDVLLVWHGATALGLMATLLP